MTMPDKGPNYSLTEAEHQSIQRFASEELAAHWKEDSAESFTLNVTFSFSALGRTVYCNVSGGPSIVISDEVGL